MLLVPDLFFLECTNILWKHVRRSTLLPETAEAHLQRLVSLGFEATPGSALAMDALQLGIQYDVTAYDASYVVLARRAKTQLITDDRRLSEKFPQEVVWLPNWHSSP